ncbi:hypothetical protein [Ottowia sp.]|uniref:hypothetical protein n=1 Tax=Ottowia sp. TaxID=1898956 RepID=UPI0025DF3824|nr:hypothetical protein [Ottowia sp.]MBK6612727.1 hypothetical protein [Ottowia sp.]
MGQVTGGVGREASKLQQTVVGVAQGKDVPAHKIPVLGRFHGNADSPSARQSAFYRRLDEVARHAEQAKGLRLEGKAAEANDYTREHPPGPAGPCRARGAETGEGYARTHP